MKLYLSSFPPIVDTPDPYVSVTVNEAIELTYKTRHIDNEKNPIWNEELNFFISPNATVITGKVSTKGVHILALVFPKSKEKVQQIDK